MRGDTGSAFGQAHRMILCAEYGLHFARDGDRGRCVEYPSLLMLRGDGGYRVGDRIFGSFDEALRLVAAGDPESVIPREGVGRVSNGVR